MPSNEYLLQYQFLPFDGNAFVAQSWGVDEPYHGAMLLSGSPHVGFGYTLPAQKYFITSYPTNFINAASILSVGPETYIPEVEQLLRNYVLNNIYGSKLAEIPRNTDGSMPYTINWVGQDARGLGIDTTVITDLLLPALWQRISAQQPSYKFSQALITVGTHYMGDIVADGAQTTIDFGFLTCPDKSSDASDGIRWSSITVSEAIRVLNPPTTTTAPTTPSPTTPSTLPITGTTPIPPGTTIIPPTTGTQPTIPTRPPTTPVPTTPTPPPPISLTSVYKPINPTTDIILVDDVVTTGLFSENLGGLSTFYTSSTHTSIQKQYYYEIYQSQSTDPLAEPQFSVTYGHADGSGSLITNHDYTTKAVYSQYKQLLLEPDDTYFTFEGGVNSKHIYVINFNVNRYKNQIDPGNLEFGLQIGSGSTYVKLIDDSGDVNNTIALSGGLRPIYNIISGSITNGAYTSESLMRYYGLLYPDMGMIILNADVLDVSCSFATDVSSNSAGDNAYKLFSAISGAAELGEQFTARNSDYIQSECYFIRCGSNEQNYSNNPSFVTGSDGTLRHPSFEENPKVYVTTIGLYNPWYELLAVAKLSQPILKSFNTELLFKIKLRY